MSYRKVTLGDRGIDRAGLKTLTSTLDQHWFCEELLLKSLYIHCDQGQSEATQEHDSTRTAKALKSSAEQTDTCELWVWR